MFAVTLSQNPQASASARVVSGAVREEQPGFLTTLAEEMRPSLKVCAVVRQGPRRQVAVETKILKTVLGRH